LKVVGGHLTGCPPAKAKAVEGMYFRFMRKGVLTKENFFSYVEQGKAADTCCNGHALSLVPGRLEAVKKRVEEQPYFKKFGLAALSLDLTHGRLFKDQELHASWWRPSELTPDKIISEGLATLHAPHVARLLESI
jgi:hypothetical protein